jgi:hypothetical protein
MSRRELLLLLTEKHRIRSVSDYAEQVVADALGGQRETNSVNRGYDFKCQRYGRVEVKFRQLPRDGRIEERCAVSDAKECGFDHLAIVILHANLTVKGAVLVPYEEAWRLIQSSNYNRVSLGQASRCPGAIDISLKVAAAARR